MATIEKYETKGGATLYRVRYRTPDNRQTDRRGFHTQKGRRDLRRDGRGVQAQRRVCVAVRRADHARRSSARHGWSASVAISSRLATSSWRPPGGCGLNLGGAPLLSATSGRPPSSSGSPTSARGTDDAKPVGAAVVKRTHYVLSSHSGRRGPRQPHRPQPGGRRQAAPHHPQAAPVPDPPAGERPRRRGGRIRGPGAAAGLHRPALG